MNLFAHTLGSAHLTLETTDPSLSKQDAILCVLIEEWQHITHIPTSCLMEILATHSSSTTPPISRPGNTLKRSQH